MMITYKMTIVNPDRCDKVIWVTGENFNEAVAKVKAYPFDEFYRGYEDGLKDALMEIEEL